VLESGPPTLLFLKVTQYVGKQHMERQLLMHLINFVSHHCFCGTIAGSAMKVGLIRKEGGLCHHIKPEEFNNALRLR